MPRSYLVDSSDDEYPPGITVLTRSRAGSTSGHHRHHDDRYFVAKELLSVPSEAGSHHRSSSAGAAPQPQFVNVVVGDRSSPERRHSRERRHSHVRKASPTSSEEEWRYREHQRKRRSELLDEEVIHKLDRLKILEKQEAEREDVILKLDKLKMYEKQEAERQHEAKLKKELEIQKARELYEREQAAKKEKELQMQYVEKWKRDEAEKKEKAKREKEEEDRKFEERFKIQFMQAGYTEAQAEAVLRKKKAEIEKKSQNAMAIDLSRPTWIKVKRKWLLPETLDHYYLPWEWDKDSEYIVIKQYVDQEMQDRLFEHTRMLKERKMITGPIEKDVLTTLKVKDKSKDKMYLVRTKSKSPGRKIYIS